MNEHAIKKLRRKFIWISFFSIVLVMVFIGGMMILFNFYTTERQARNTLDFLSENGGMLTDAQGDNDRATSDTPYHQTDEDASAVVIMRQILRDMFNTQIHGDPEAIRSVRFFSVTFNADGEARAETSRIYEVSKEVAVAYASLAVSQNKEYGEIADFRYKVTEDGDNTLVILINVANEMANSRRLIFIGIGAGAFGAALAFVIIRILSNRAIRPEIRNAENQKRFITNASHELKTPLAVIRANTELEMMMHGEDEWNQSTMNQVDRMTGLIQNLVLIAKADEKANKEELSEIDVSSVVSQTADTFAPVAVQSGKTLTKDIPADIAMPASEAQIRQLASLLIDNAIKYCDDSGEITVAVRQKGKGIRLSVSNSYAEGKDVDYSRFFDRFYREDSSHNIDKGGYGIGLSIAESLVRQYQGKISADWADGVITFTCLLK